MAEKPAIIYLGRSRLHRSRANLIQTLHTCSAFEQLGWRVRLYLPPWPGDASLQAKLAEIGADPAPEVRFSRLLHPRWSFWPFVWVNRGMLREATALYIRSAQLSHVLAAAGLRHDLEVHDVEALRDKGRAERVIACHRKGIIRTLVPISHAAADWLIDAGAVADRVHVAPSGVKLELFADLPPFDPLRLERPRIVHLGRLTGPRGLAVFEHVARRGDCQITILSADSVEIENATCHAPVPPVEVPFWYARSDLTLIPNQPEQATAASMSPIKMFEAMAAGRPIIASNLPTIREVLRQEHNALLVEPADLAAWDAAIDRLRGDRELAQTLARNAKTDSEHYSWRNRARGIARVIGLAR
jgi:glycosyltransferase involved in cell wall biosynthesis